jgi:hypothetical protein
VRISLRSDKLASDNRPGSAIRQHAKGRPREYGKRLDDEEELEEDEKEQQFNNAKGMMLIWAAPQRRGLIQLVRSATRKRIRSHRYVFSG